MPYSCTKVSKAHILVAESHSEKMKDKKKAKIKAFNVCVKTPTVSLYLIVLCFIISLMNTKKLYPQNSVLLLLTKKKKKEQAVPSSIVGNWDFFVLLGAVLFRCAKIFV